MKEFRTHDGEVFVINLLPCPFCSADPEMKMSGNYHHKRRRITVRCRKCRIERSDASISNNNLWLVRVAEKNWNARSTVPAEVVDIVRTWERGLMQHAEAMQAIAALAKHGEGEG